MFKNWYTITGTGNGNRLRQYAVQIHQSAERLILRQISSLMHPKIQRRQVIMNVLHPGCARPPRWSPPVLWRRLEDGLASICVLIHSCKMSRESETTGLNDERKCFERFGPAKRKYSRRPRVLRAYPVNFPIQFK